MLSVLVSEVHSSRTDFALRIELLCDVIALTAERLKDVLVRVIVTGPLDDGRRVDDVDLVRLLVVLASAVYENDVDVLALVCGRILGRFRYVG